MPPGRMKRKISRTDSAATFFEPGAERDDGDRLRQPQHDAAHEGAERMAEAADDGGDEAGDRERHADVEGGVLRRRDQHAGDGAERRADSANDSDSIRETLMPCSDAASRLKAQARIALPVLRPLEELVEQDDQQQRYADDPEELVADRRRRRSGSAAGR